MARKTITLKEIIGKLREAQSCSIRGSRSNTSGVARVSAHNRLPQRQGYGGRWIAQARHQIELGKEKGGLKMLVVDLSRGSSMLRCARQHDATRQRCQAITQVQSRFPISECRACQIFELARRTREINHRSSLRQGYGHSESLHLWALWKQRTKGFTTFYGSAKVRGLLNSA